MKNTMLKILTGGTALATLGGCTLGVVADAEKTIQRDRNDTSRLVEAAKKPLPKKHVGPIVVSDDIWLGSRAVSRTNGHPLPLTVERDGVALVSSYDVGIVEVANMIRYATGIKVVLDDDLFNPLVASGGEEGNGEQGGAFVGSDDSSTDPAFDGGDAPAADGSEDNTQFESGETTEPMAQEDTTNFSSGGATSSSDIMSITVGVQHEGKLSDFLDDMAVAFAINWEYKDGVIRFFKNETKTFLMKILPGTISNTMSMSSNGGTEGGGATAQGTSSQYNVNIWDEMVDAMSDLVTSSGGLIAASPSTGTVTVTVNSSTMRKLERLVQEQNDRFSQQITVNVKVLTIALSDEDGYATDINGLNLNNDWIDTGFSREGAGGVGNLAYTLLKPTSLAGVGGVIDALSTKGDVSIVTSSNATTLNNVPTPVQVSNTKGYIESVTIETSEEGESVTLNPEQVTTGFNMQIVPRIMSNGVVGLQYSISTSELVGKDGGFNEVAYGGNVLQLLDVNSRAFAQQVMIPNGNTLILSGFEQQRNSVSKEGFGVAENWLMGGSNKGAMRRDMMVIMITPEIVDGQKLIEEM